MMVYNSKPVEEMTVRELREEKELHMWLAHAIRRIGKGVQFKIDATEYNRSLGKSMDGSDEVSEAYINGLISDEEYKNYRKSANMSEGFYRYIKERREARVKFADIIDFHHRAYAAMLQERIDELIGKPKRKKRNLKEYGYNPRKYCSKRNRRRTDWQQSRKNREQQTDKRPIQQQEE